MRSTNRPSITTSAINRNFSLGIGESLRIPQNGPRMSLSTVLFRAIHPVRVSQRKLIRAA